MPNTRRATRVLLALTSLSVAGCFPVMMHGPRVQPGLAGTLTASQASGETHTEGDAGGIRVRTPTIGAGVGYGWRAASPAHPSLYAGLVGPVPQMDLYLQAPEAWTGRTAGGVGLSLSFEEATPYLQWGMVSERGAGWSITQGVSVRHGPEDYARVVWIPGVTAHLGSGQPAAHLFVMGAYGREKSFCNGLPPCPTSSRPVSAVMAGLTLEIRRSRPK